MTIYSQNDVRVKIKGLDLYCSNVNVGYDNEVNPIMSIATKGGYEYSPNRPAVGKFSINYFLTGIDPIFEYAISGSVPVSLEFAGLYVNSGYLSSYSLNAEPYATPEIQASFSFAEVVKGTFSPQNSPVPEIDPLCVSDVSLVGGTIIKDDNIKSLSYSWTAPGLRPTYEVSETIDYSGNSPVGMRSSSPHKVESQLSLYDYDISLPITGLREAVSINFNDKNGNTKQTYEINGVLKNKSIGAKVGDRVISDYSIGQANLGGSLPNITGFHPHSGDIGSTVAISGENFVNIDTVRLGEFKCDISGEYTSNKIHAIVSKDIMSGYKAPISVTTHGGESLSSGYLVTSGISYLY